MKRLSSPSEKRHYTVIVSARIKPQPDKNERIVAELMAGYLMSDVEFVMRTSSTTPDLYATRLGQIWEIKNIRGNSKNTIGRTLKGIYRQSENVIITFFRTKMTPAEAIGRAKEKISHASRIKRLVIITKTKKIIVVK